MKFTAFVVLALLALAAVAYARQDEALDSMMMNELEAVTDPLPRLLAEALGTPSAVGAYAADKEAATSIPTETVPPSTPSSSSAASAGAFSLLAAAVLALAMF